MKITQRMRDEAADAIGFSEPVDDQRIGEAFYVVQHELKIDTLEAAKERLEELWKVFEARGGRGVELADCIDNLRIYIAVKEYK